MIKRVVNCYGSFLKRSRSGIGTFAESSVHTDEQNDLEDGGSCGHSSEKRGEAIILSLEISLGKCSSPIFFSAADRLMSNSLSIAFSVSIINVCFKCLPDKVIQNNSFYSTFSLHPISLTKPDNPPLYLCIVNSGTSDEPKRKTVKDILPQRPGTEPSGCKALVEAAQTGLYAPEGRIC